MNRYDIEFVNGKHIKIYADNEKKARDKLNWYRYECYKISIIKNPEHLKYIEMIKQCSKLVGSTVRNNDKREHYYMVNHNGRFDIFISKDIRDNMYYEIIQYRHVTGREILVPILRTLTTPDKFCKEFLDSPYKYERLSYRKYGEPKLDKPKELSKNKQAFSGVYIPKHCSCPCHINGNDLFIKHRDFFSPSYCKSEDCGTPLSYRLKKYGLKSKETLI